MEFGELLRDKRIEYRYSQKQLAELAGVKIWSISAYEVGRVSPSIVTAYRLSKVLNCPELCPNMTTGEKIKVMRSEKGLSQEEFAEAVGVNRIAVSSWERGKNSPPAKTQRKIAEVLECSITDLF